VFLVSFLILLRYRSISLILKVSFESNDALELVIDLMYNERASEITVEFVLLLRNMSTDSFYIKKVEKPKVLSILYHT
jgi:hypothetical protein